MDFNGGPNATALKFARILLQAETDGVITLDALDRDDAKRLVAWQAEHMARIKRQYAAQDERAAQIKALLDSDTPVAKGAHRCEASVASRGSWTYTPTCSHDAKVVRTWSEYRWVAGERTETVKQMFLCGTHSQVKGSYGFPY